ncbi:MAG TPA: thiol peroxidase, partial [bacterium]|nr:thiol peroxidase [bacterium]
MPVERPNAFTIAGNPLTLVGPELRPGDAAPDFRIQSSTNLQPLGPDASAGKTRVLLSVSSIDTPVCDNEALAFSRRAAEIPDVEILVVSVDQPFAHQRWCREHGVDNLSFGSDHRDVSFGEAYGVLVKETRTLSRAAFVVSPENRIVFAQYLP